MLKRLPSRLALFGMLVWSLALQWPAKAAPPTIDQPGSCAQMPAGLVGCWSGDGTAADAGGRYDAAWDAPAQYVRGMHGQAFSFNGQSQVTVGDPAAAAFTASFTLAAWINPSGLNADPQFGGIFAKVANGTGLKGYQTALVNNNQTLVFLFNAPNEPWPGSVLSVNLPQPIAIGQWAHVAFSFDGEDMRVYLDGAEVGRLHTGPKAVATSLTPLRISGDGNNNVKFKGLIDEAAAFDRALTAQEIQDLAQPPLRVTSPAQLENLALAQSTSQVITAAGGVGPHAFSVSGGALPPGLTLDADGTLRGTATTAGSYAFTVQVQDAAGHANTMDYQLGVLSPGVTPSIQVTSDGRFGPASRYFFDNYAVNYHIHTDSCQIYQQYSNYPWDPYQQPAGRIIAQPNGSDICVLDFTTFDINLGSSSLDVVGSRPLVIATQGDVSIRGNIRFYNNGGLGGTRPEGNFVTGANGFSAAGAPFQTGGTGGWGVGFVFNSPSMPWGWDVMSGQAGGGGGAASRGEAGLGPVTQFGTSPGSDVNFAMPAPAPGGSAQAGDVLQGGGGGGQGGYARTWYCCWTGGPGGAGGGAVMFASGGAVRIQSGSSLNADGLPNPYFQGDGGGGGAGGGGYIVIDAAGPVENAGVISARGGAGTRYTQTIAGPSSGAGGRVAIVRANGVTNTGTIDVAGGDRVPVRGGEFNASGLPVGGSVLGIGTAVMTGATTPVGAGVTTHAALGDVSFTEVLQPGVTDITALDPSQVAAVPFGYTQTGGVFDVTTTATTQGSIVSCFPVRLYAPSWTLFSRIRILHQENGVLVDRTILAPDQPSPNWDRQVVCARTTSLSPFVIALADAPAASHYWHADYILDYLGVRTSSDAFADVVYPFEYGWHLGIFNDPNGPLDDAAITVTPANASITAVTPVDNGPFSWTRHLDPGGAYTIDLGGGIAVPQPSTLGYEVTREVIGGRRIAGGATETRTFQITFVPRDPALTQVGASINFNGLFSPTPIFITPSDIACTGPGLVATEHAPEEIYWQVGHNDGLPATITADTPYTLTCTLTLTNSSPYAVSYTPAIVAAGQVAYPQATTTNPFTYVSANTGFGPADPLGTAVFSTTTPDTQVWVDQKFQRTVIFDGENRVIDEVAPTTSASMPATSTGWYTAPVPVTLSALDPSPSSGLKQLTYTLSGASSGGGVTPGSAITLNITAEGTTVVTAYAEDQAGNVEAAKVFVVKLDSTAPVVTVTAPATMLEGQAITVSASATDASNTLTYQWSILSGGGQLTPNGASATYLRRQPGNVTLQVRVSDGRGNQTLTPVAIQVLNVAPAVTVPGGGTVLTNQVVSASASFADPGNDGPWVAQANYGDGSPVAILPIVMNPDNRSGTFVLAHAWTTPGDFTVLVSVTDAFGATGTNAVPVHVEAPDTTAPVLATHDITVTATDPAGTVVDYAVQASDDRSTPTVACSPTSGSLFVIGDTQVSCTATDAAGNSTTATFTVTVIDGVAPVITAPIVPVTEATSAAGAAVSFAATATDNVGVASVTCSTPSGSAFAIGSTAVTCTAADAAGNTASVTFDVTVVDTTAPVLTAPSVVTAQATSAAGAAVSFAVSALDVVDGAITPACAPASGTTFPIGSTTVTCTATDAHGNTASATFAVKVNDGAAPVVTVTPSGDRVVEATSAAGAAVMWTASASDDVDGTLSVTCSPASGATFPLGATSVTCTATDAAGNTGTASFLVTVVDTTAPQLTLPLPITVATTDPSGAVVTFVTSAIDAVDGAVPVTCAPASGSRFPVGETTVTCAAADTRGHRTEGHVVVMVRQSDGRLNRFVALSQDGTWINQGTRIVSGDVGATLRRDASHAHVDDNDTPSSITVRLHEGVTMVEAGARVVGDSVMLHNKAVVGDVVDNVLVNLGATIRGSVTSPMAVPFLDLPAFPSITAGALAVDVAKGKTRILAAGQWGAVHVSQGATLVVTGGLYEIASLDIDPQGVVIFRGATELRVAGRLLAGAKSQLILDQAVAGLKASDMRIYVAGTGDAASFGEQAVVQANVYAPNGTVWLNAKSQATGAFIGAHVRVGQGVTLTLDSAWR